jgi:hypothetical protein
LFLLLAFLLCLFFKCCSPILHDSIENTEDQSELAVPNHSENRRNHNGLFGGMPSRPHLLSPIDTNNIFLIPNDPLGRRGVDNLLNIYLTDTTTIESFVSRVCRFLPEDTIEVSYYAEEYKRVQLKMNPSRRIEIKSILKGGFPEIKFVVDEWILQGLSSVDQDDPGFLEDDQTWFYEMVGVFDAWKTTMGDSAIKIAVIDDSFDPNHVEFKNRFVKSWNVFNYSDRVYSDGQNMSHGTHVAATVAGNADNGFGISGVAPHCMVMPIQISDRSGIISHTSILDGVFYALKNDADVINLSLAMSLRGVSSQLTEQEQRELSSSMLTEEAAMWDEVYRIANEEGTIIVQAAGNDAVLSALDPMKRSRQTIIVGALDRHGKISGFSNTGESVTVYAPGVQIYSALPDNKFGPQDGTSMASPIIAGCIGLIKSVKPDIQFEDLVRLIEATGTHIDEESGVVIHVDKTLSQLQ